MAFDSVQVRFRCCNALLYALRVLSFRSRSRKVPMIFSFRGLFSFFDFIKLKQAHLFRNFLIVVFVQCLFLRALISYGGISGTVNVIVGVKDALLAAGHLEKLHHVRNVGGFEPVTIFVSSEVNESPWIPLV